MPKTETPSPTAAPAATLPAALAAAQGQMQNPTKTKTANVITKGGTKYQYHYADLAEIIDTVRAPLAANGLAFVQLVQTGEAGNVLLTRLLHTSGEAIESSYPLPRQAGAQEMGSAITYARRYSLCAILGIAGEDDEDGARAEQIGQGKTEQARDALIELMGAASLGNKAVMDYCRAHALGDGKSVEGLDDKAVAHLLENWKGVLAWIEGQRQPSSPAAAECKPEPDRAVLTGPPATTPADDLAGIPAKLAELMRRDGVTAARLKSYYTAKKHLPDTVEPAKLPARYWNALIIPENWNKALAFIREA